MNSFLDLLGRGLDAATHFVQSIQIGTSDSSGPSGQTSAASPVRGSDANSTGRSNPGSTLILEEFRRSMIRLRTRNECEDEILRFARVLFETEVAGLLLWDDEKGMFVNRNSMPGARNAWNIYDPFFLSISEHDRVLERSRLDSVSDDRDRGQIEEFMDVTGARWVLPMILNEAVLAVLFAGDGDADPDAATLEDFRSYGVLSLSNSIIYTRVESLLLSLEDKVRERTRQLEEATNQMIQSEKMVTLGVMVAGVAHELNTPSGVILNAARNLRENIESLLDRVLVSDWLHTPEQVAEFAHIARFFNYHLLTGSLAVPRNAFHLRRVVAASLAEAGVREPDELAAFFTEFGFFDDPESAAPDKMRERLEGEHLLTMIVAFHEKLEEPGRRIFLGYLRDTAGIHRNAKNITASAVGISRLVKALRIYSRTGQGDLVLANVEELLESTLEVLGSVWKHKVEVIRSFERLPAIECDPDSLNQVWSNLLMNAYQAARENPKPQLIVTTRLEGDGSHIGVFVRDNGPGIPESLREKIWDPFFTTKEQGEGTGLGLAIVRRIVDEHRGEIGYTTGEEGTEFRVRLPVRRPVDPPSGGGTGPVSKPPGPTGRYDWR